MNFQDFVEDQVFSPTLVATALRTTRGEIAHTLGLGQDAFSRVSRIRARKTQTRLRQMLEILHRVSSHTGSDLAAYAWFRAEPLPGFGEMTPDQLVREGKADNVHAHLDRIMVGGYAWYAVLLMHFRGLVYRAHNPRWTWSPTSGEGARRYGGRFNRIGAPALYTSLSPVTALREASQIGRPLQPITLCAYEVDAEPVFDTLDPSHRETQEVGTDDIFCQNWEQEMLSGIVPASQRLADRLIAAGYVGMRVQSFAPGTRTDDLNLVLWRWGAQGHSKVVLIDDEGRLPIN